MRKKNLFTNLFTIIITICLATFSGCEWMATPPVTAEDLTNVISTTLVPEIPTAPLTEPEPETTAPEIPTTPEIPTMPEEPPVPVLQEVRFMSVGDNLIHNTVLNAGKQADGSYDFSMLFDGMNEYFAQADLSCINQETIFTANPAKYGGYPAFGSPTMVGDAIVEAGFDIVLHASNHSLDMTSRGVLDTIEYWNQYPEIAMLGIHDTKEDADKITIIEQNGISFAIFNYTYGLNGYTPPKDKPWMVDQMTNDTKSKIIAELEEARGLADVVVVYPHWGGEYVYKPNDFQKEWAKIFADCNVDIVIGHHPHVLQPMDTMERADGKEMLIYYSVGNYCSHQAEVPRMLGGIADILICKQGDEVWLESAQLVPIVTQIQPGYFTTYLLTEYTDELAKKHKFNGTFGFSKYNPTVLWKLYTDITGFDAEDMEFLDEKLAISK